MPGTALAGQRQVTLTIVLGLAPAGGDTLCPSREIVISIRQAHSRHSLGEAGRRGQLQQGDVIADSQQAELGVLENLWARTRQVRPASAQGLRVSRRQAFSSGPSGQQTHRSQEKGFWGHPSPTAFPSCASSPAPELGPCPVQQACVPLRS